MTTLSKNVTNKSALPSVAMAYQGFVEEPVPSKLFDAVVSGNANRTLELLKAFALVLLGVLLTLTVGYLANNRADAPIATMNINDLAVSAHATFAKDAVYPVRVSADDPAHLRSWLSYRMGKNIELQLIDNIGFTLLGGNVIPDGDQTSVSLVYENQERVRLSLFIRKATATAITTTTAKQGLSGVGANQQYNWLSWESKGNQLVLVSELAISELEKVQGFIP